MNFLRYLGNFFYRLSSDFQWWLDHNAANSNYHLLHNIYRVLKQQVKKNYQHQILFYEKTEVRAKFPDNPQNSRKICKSEKFQNVFKPGKLFQNAQELLMFITFMITLIKVHVIQVL